MLKEQNKDILIVANFCRDFSDEDNGRFMYLCKLLSAIGHDVEIVTSDFSHASKAHKPPHTHEWPFKITFLHEPGYSRNISPSRLLSHAAWGREVGKYLASRRKPDVVYCAMPSLTAAVEVARFCEREGLRFVVDVQDLWPEAFRLAFNFPIVSDSIFAPMAAIADYAYAQADAVCAVSETYAERAMRVNRKGAKTYVVYLGTELATFDAYACANSVSSHHGELWLGYCGTLGASYDLTTVIHALALVRDLGIEPPRLVAMGDGERRGEFEVLAASLGIKSTFTGRLPYPKMCGMLAACDMAVNPIARGAAQSIINKHGDYAAAGIPVLNTQESSEYCNLVDTYRMGLNCNCGDAVGLASAIAVLSTDERARRQLGANARKCAEERFDRARTYTALCEAIAG